MQSSNCNKKLNFKVFSKIQIRVETRVDDLHFINWDQTQKISFLRRNFRFKARSSNFPKYTKMIYFCDPFFSLTSNLLEDKHCQDYKLIWIFFITQHERSKRKPQMKKCFQSLCKSLDSHQKATEWRLQHSWVKDSTKETQLQTN